MAKRGNICRRRVRVQMAKLVGKMAFQSVSLCSCAFFLFFPRFSLLTHSLAASTARQRRRIGLTWCERSSVCPLPLLPLCVSREQCSQDRLLQIKGRKSVE